MISILVPALMGQTGSGEKNRAALAMLVATLAFRRQSNQRLQQVEWISERKCPGLAYNHHQPFDTLNVEYDGM